MPCNIPTRCGYIAIIGRPNVGKSTLLNHLLGQKLSITSDKPQTTRHAILGIKTRGTVQFLYVDTPGIHKTAHRLMNRQMNRAALSQLSQVDVVVWMIDARAWTDEDELILKKLESVSCPVILALNKIDRIKDKKKLLPFLDTLSKKRAFAQMVPLSVLKGIHRDELEDAVGHLLPERPFLFPAEQITDRDDRFLASEIIREKIMRATGAELPYDTAVVIEDMRKKADILHIEAVIWVERPGQKIIIVGKKGDKIKRIGTMARGDLEKKFKCQVFLGLWVKVKTGWSDNKQWLAAVKI